MSVYYYYYAAFNAPCVGHKDDESQAIAAYFAYCHIFAYFSKVRISHIFPHKLAFSTAILILLAFLLPISISFRYLDHLVANRMALSMCPVPCGTRWGSWLQAILSHISAHFRRIFGVYAVRIFLKLPNKNGVPNLP